VAFYDLSSLLAEIMAIITLREIHEVRRAMTDILLDEKLERHKYTRYNLYSCRDIVHFRVSVYSANPNFEDLPAYFCASENGEIIVHTPNGISKRFIHQNLLEMLSVVKEEMINLKVELKKF
jgi:hypothetical protein